MPQRWGITGVLLKLPLIFGHCLKLDMKLIDALNIVTNILLKVNCRTDSTSPPALIPCISERFWLPN